MTTSCGSDRSTRCSTSAASGTGTIVNPLPFTQRARKSGTVRPAVEKKSIVGLVPRTFLFCQWESASQHRPLLVTVFNTAIGWWLEAFHLVDLHDLWLVLD